MARTPKLLASTAQVSNAAATKYTVPAVTLTLVRHVHVYNPGPAAATFTMSIGADAAGTRVWDAISIASGVDFDRFVYWPLAAATIIQAFSGTNNQLTLTIGGDEIILG